MKRASFNLKSIALRFDIPGDFVYAERYGTGHINDTFVSVFDQAGTRIRYLHQRINHHVFQDVEGLMDNVARVTAHQRRRLAAQKVKDVSRRALTLVRTREGGPFVCTDDGNYWRTYLFIERARTFDIIEQPAQAHAAARAFGEFLKLLEDLGGPRLCETIPGFHDTPARFAAFEAAVAADARNRAALAKPEIDFALARRALCGRLLALRDAGRIPERVTHNDTKLNNVLLDDATGEGICVIDLDTCMPGFSLYDFGDMVRTATNSAAEDERDLAKVNMRAEMFEPLVQGFLGTARDALAKDEIDLLPYGGVLMTFECGIRFLADFLAGDTYFRIHREHQNLDRCRTQFRLVQQMEDAEAELRAIVDRHR